MLAGCANCLDSPFYIDEPIPGAGSLIGHSHLDGGFAPKSVLLDALLVADRPPPALSGGTLSISANGSPRACAGTPSNAHVPGAGRRFQVPSLRGLGLRAPYMHDGCAATLRARFDVKCGGGDQHGKTSQLSAAELGDLISYLQTL